jgi:hypothetical protein
VRRGRFGSELLREHAQNPHFRDYHLDGRLLPRRCGEALGGEPDGGRAEAGGAGVRYTFRRCRGKTVPWWFAAGEHFVQDGAEGGHIGATIGIDGKAVRGQQYRARRSQHDRGWGYFAVRATGLVQLAESGGYIRGATQCQGQGQGALRQSAGKGLLSRAAIAAGRSRHILT